MAYKELVAGRPLESRYGKTMVFYWRPGCGSGAKGATELRICGCSKALPCAVSGGVWNYFLTKEAVACLQNVYPRG